mgnify:CR=1 FL=1
MDWYNKLWSYSVELFRNMEIPVRQLECCSGDLADLKVKSCDIEAWSPRQQKYFEVCSCSNLGDAQARRLGIRIKGAEGGEENKLIMDWHPEDAKFYAARFSDLVLADGTHPVITTEWQDLVIDLEASGFPGMTNALHIRAFAKCVIYLDEITFSEAVAPIDATSSETIQAGLTAPETGKPGDLPIKDYLAELE